jgi:hypothetical protein
MVPTSVKAMYKYYVAFLDAFRILIHNPSFFIKRETFHFLICVLFLFQDVATIHKSRISGEERVHLLPNIQNKEPYAEFSSPIFPHVGPCKGKVR